MKKQSREALDAYFAYADSWARDRRAGAAKLGRVAWIVAAGAVTVAVAEAIALMLLMPLKTVEPYTLLVDRQTGYVQALKPLDPQLVSSEGALTQSFLVQYVIAREGYDIDSLQTDYQKVGMWSSGDARRSYVEHMAATNADSPLTRYPRTTVIDVTIKSVTSMSKTAAMVRYDTQRRDAGGRAFARRAWVAIVRYGLNGAPMSVADRLVNPLGFQVTRYRRSIEILPASPLAPTREAPISAVRAIDARQSPGGNTTVVAPRSTDTP